MLKELSSIWFTISGIKILDLGRITERSYHPFRPQPDFCVFGIVGRGQRSIRIDDTLLSVETGQYFLLPNGYSHSGIENDEHDVCYVHFMARRMEGNRPSSIDSEKLILPMTGSLPVEIDCFKLMNYLYMLSKQSFIKDETCVAQFKAILQQVSIYNQRCAIWGSKRIPIVDNIIKYIRSNIGKTLIYRDYEEQFGFSYRYMNEMVKAEYNKTIKQIQLELKMDLASILLHSGKTIEETATAVGFQDYFYFIKCFKRYQGVTPGEYQKEMFV
ncbi:MAG TPA: helix-turn-helix transcriptional regulator [Thermoanaerobacterales bacterium]|jgi:AraC-like DNA-binding protein|nr:helix-turn-helix transcriptional regulator [Thermoanaerobacterales bacterium]